MKIKNHENEQTHIQYFNKCKEILERTITIKKKTSNRNILSSFINNT